MAVCEGKEALKQKSDWWRANHEVHGAAIEGPFVNGDQFAVRIKYGHNAEGKWQAHHDGRGRGLYR